MSSRTRILLVVLLAVVFTSFLALAGCGNGQAEQPKDAQTSEQPTDEPAIGMEESELYTPEYQPTGQETAVIKTSKGSITVKLYGKDAPIHVGNFVELARKGFYNDTKFHRFVEGFVVQGGDPDTKNATSEQVAAEAAKGDGGGRYGVGGPGYYIKGEFDPAVNPNKHTEGALGMARSMNPDSAGSQFYFALQPLPQLDGSYTVFGQVTEGLDVVKQLRGGDVIESVEIK